MISVDKNRAYNGKKNKYANTKFKSVIPIAMDYYFEMHYDSYNRLTKYMSGDTLKQNLAFWLSRMMSE